MATPYTPDPTAGTWTSVTLPDDGDLKNAASVDLAFQALADKGSRYIDGYSGATYTPSSTIVIDGSFGMNIASLAANVATINSLTETGGGASFLGPMTCFGTVDISGVTNFTNTVNYGPSTGTNWPATSIITGASGALLAWSGTVDFDGPIQLVGDVALSGDTTNTGVITNSGAGRLRLRLVDGLNANHTYTIDDADVIMVVNGSLSANRTYVLSVTGAVTGDVIRFVNEDPTFKITANGVDHRSTTGEIYETTWIFRGAAWESLSSSVTP